MTVRLLTIAEVLTQFEDMRNNGSLSVANRTALNRAYWILKDVEADEMLDRAGVRLVWQSTGKWLPRTAYDGFTYWRCDNCRVDVDETTNYCPHCGARMERSEEE